MATSVIGIGETDTTITNWETRVDGVLAAPQIGTCKAENFAENVVFDGSTTSATNYLEVTSVAASQHDGRSNAVSGDGNARWTITAKQELLDDHIRISWMEIIGPGNVGQPVFYCAYQAAGADHKVHHNIVHNDGAYTTNEAQPVFALYNADGIYRIYRNIVYGHGGGLNYVEASAAGSAIYCNTIYKCNLCNDAYAGGIDTESCANYDIKSNASFTNLRYDIYGTLGTLDYNATSDTTGDAEGANGIADLVVGNQFTNPTATYSACDLTIRAGSGLIDEGTDPCSGTYTNFPEINYPITNRTTAITGTWDIGADEYVAVGGRTTKNSRAWPLGVAHGMGLRMGAGRS